MNYLWVWNSNVTEWFLSTVLRIIYSNYLRMIYELLTNSKLRHEWMIFLTLNNTLRIRKTNISRYFYELFIQIIWE